MPKSLQSMWVGGPRAGQGGAAGAEVDGVSPSCGRHLGSSTSSLLLAGYNYFMLIAN